MELVLWLIRKQNWMHWREDGFVGNLRILWLILHPGSPYLSENLGLGNIEIVLSRSARSDSLFAQTSDVAATRYEVV
jgi:hypothetical protein